MLKTIDKFIGFIFIAIAGIVPRDGKIKKDANKILVIRFSGIGETLLALPMVKILRENGYSIDGFALRNRAGVVFKNCRLFKKVYGFTDLLNLYQKYDIAIDCEAFTNFSALVARYCAKTTIGFAGLERSKLYDYKINYNDKQHVVYTFCDMLAPLGIKNVKISALEPLVYENNTLENAKKFINPYRKEYKKLIGIYPSSEKTVPERRWKKYPEFIDALLEKYKDALVFITGSGTEDARICKEVTKNIKNKERLVNTCNKFSFNEFCCFVKQLNLFVSNDSGPMHIAAAMGVPTIGLFGPNIPLRFGPFGKNNIGIYKCGPECKPSINVHLGEFKSNPKAAECINKIDVKDVIEASEKILNSK